MNGVYISGIEVPEKCKDCQFCVALHYLYDYCTAGEFTVLHRMDRRSPHCPLVPVPDHGRLIEEHDAVRAFYDTYQEYGLPWKNAEVVFEKCKTILPSDYSFDGSEKTNAGR